MTGNNIKNSEELKYISKNLTKEEKILVAAKTCGWFYKPFCYFFSIFLTFVFLICIINTDESEFYDVFIGSLIAYPIIMLPIVWIWFTFKAMEMAVTNKRVIHKKGIFIHKTDELRLQKVESINIRKSFWGLIFGYATIVFTGTGNQVVKFSGIAHPQEIKNEIDEVFEVYAK
ncbi:MAG: PH domain-containing protein [Alphaproteobacteria bacterium]|nr:PH domain-containing protein [Alphaproteobacteria bacterium]